MITRWIYFLLLTGCCPHNLTPPCCIPEISRPVVAAYQEMEEKGTLVDEVWDQGVWWQSFQDPQLCLLMGEALGRNPRISLLESRLRTAYGEVKRAGSRLYPKFDLLADFDFEQDTRTGQFPVLYDLPFEFGLWTLQMNLYYDIDLWKKNRDRLGKYLGLQRASQLEYDWGAFLLCLSLAENYYKWQITFKMTLLQQALLEKQEEVLDQTRQLVEHNLASVLILIDEELNLERFEEDLSAFQQEAEGYAHAVQALAGDFELCLQEAPLPLQEILPFKLPKSLTLDLVGHRADIQAQIWKIESARKGVDLAKKEFYPDIDLTAFWGFSTIEIGKWFSTASTNWILNPAFHLPIFHGGELRANLLIAHEEYVQEVADYNQSVIDATKEILDLFSWLRAEESIHERIGQEALLLQRKIILEAKRVEHHLEPKTTLLQKEIDLLNVKIREKQSEIRIMMAILGLIRSTGG